MFPHAGKTSAETVTDRGQRRSLLRRVMCYKTNCGCTAACSSSTVVCRSRRVFISMSSIIYRLCSNRFGQYNHVLLSVLKIHLRIIMLVLESRAIAR